MSGVAIVTDSTNCLPPELIKEYQINVVPVGMVIDGQYYRDQVDISTAEFWNLFPRLKEQPTTTAVNPEDCLKTFTELSKSTNEIVCILLSRVLSATQESAYQARRMVRQDLPHLDIKIIDSKTSSGALGLVVLEAARAAQQNKSMAEVIQIAENIISRVFYLIGVDTLKYLIKIGRAPKTAANFGEFLQVKPIVGFVDDTGLLNMVARVRGRHKQLIKIVDLVNKYIDTGEPIHAMVHYADGRDVGEELKEMITSRYSCSEIYVTQFSPVMISATGPAVGLSFYS